MDIGSGVIERAQLLHSANHGEVIDIRFEGSAIWCRTTRSQFTTDAEFSRLLSFVFALKTTMAKVFGVWRVSDHANGMRNFKGFDF